MHVLYMHCYVFVPYRETSFDIPTTLVPLERFQMRALPADKSRKCGAGGKGERENRKRVARLLKSEAFKRFNRFLYLFVSSIITVKIYMYT